MAEETKKDEAKQEEIKKKAYKYIDTDIDQDWLLTNLKHNAQNYVRHKNWDTSKANEFYAALNKYEDAITEGRLSSLQSGDIEDSAGILNNGAADWRDKNGNVLSEEQYNALSDKDKKKLNPTKDFYANREVAGYINSIVKELYSQQTKDKSKEEKKKKDTNATKFNLDTHGLWQNFMASMAPSGTGDIEALLDLDPYDQTTKKRATTKRAESLSNYIDTYINNLDEDLDFSPYKMSGWGDRDSYIGKLRALQEELKNGIDSTDYRLLSALGANPEQYRAFFTTAERYLTGEEAQAAQDQAAADKMRKELQGIQNNMAKNYNSKGYQKYIPHDSSGVKYDKNSSDPLTSYIDALNDKSILFNPEELKTSNGREYAPYLKQYSELVPEAFETADSASKYAGWKYMPESFNEQDGSVLGVDPTTGAVSRKSMQDLGGNARTVYAQLIKNLYGRTQNATQPLFQQESSSIPIETFNIGTSATADFYQKQMERSKITKVDLKRRQPGKSPSNYNENEIFTDTDKMRLTSIAADIAALIDPEAISAFCIGAGSDVMNLTADLKEGYGLGKSLGNFAANLGLSAVGMIPIFGDAVGSGGKIVKNIVKLLPKMSKALVATGALATISNGDEILKSLNKIGKDGVENQMSVEDWRNVAMAIQFALGGAKVARNQAGMKKLKNLGKTDGKAVVVKEKESGEVKQLVFYGKDDKAAIDAALKNGSVKDMNNLINSHPSYKGKYEILTREKTSHKMFGENSKWYKPWTWRSATKESVLAKNTVHDYIDWDAARRAAKELPIWSSARQFSKYPWLNNNNVIGAQTAAEATGQTLGLLPAPAPIRGYLPASIRYSAPRPRGSAGPTIGPSGTPIGLPPTPYSTQRFTTSWDALLRGNPETQRPIFNTPFSTRYSVHGLRGSAGTPTGLPTPYSVQQLTSKSNPQKIGNLVRKARQYNLNVKKNRVGVKHSKEYNQLLKHGLSKSELKNMGAYARGGIISWETKKKIIKAAGGTSIYDAPIWIYGSGRKPSYIIDGKNFGAGYSSNLDYSNGEYGTTDLVDLTAIENADPELRNKSRLTTAHGAKDYNYRNAQFNTNKARKSWQDNESNRINDFVNWAKSWYENSENKGRTQLDMLADYNKAIDAMYDYKREMGTAEHSGENSYRQGKEVRNFNRTNKAIYGSANTVGGVHGYDEDYEDINGTTTAQRFIDITDQDLTNLNFDLSEVYKGADENFKSLFSNLAKDATGRYYVKSDNLKTDNYPSLTAVEPTNPDRTEIPKENDENTPTESKFSWNSGDIFTDIAPTALAGGRYLASRALNKALLKNTEKMPVLPFNPKGRNRWLEGDQNAVWRGQRFKGLLAHLAANPISADAAQQTAQQFEAADKGVDYVEQNNAINDKAFAASREANWTQQGENQQSRYDVANKNRENLFEHRVNLLEAKNAYKRANYESLNALLSQFEKEAKTQQEEREAIRKQIDAANLQNSISANMAAYGIAASADDQELMNDLLTGNREIDDLTDDEVRTYNRLSAAISEAITQQTAARYGLRYQPFASRVLSRTTSSYDIIPPSGESTTVTSSRQGGVIESDSEKVTIQKLRGRIQKMQARQKHLEARMNAYEKDLDRAQKGASDYIKGQKRSKSK